jgi:hypothetical protein
LHRKLLSETVSRCKHPHNFLDLIFKEQKVGVLDPDRERAIIHVDPARSTEFMYYFSTGKAFIFSKLRSPAMDMFPGAVWINPRLNPVIILAVDSTVISMYRANFFRASYQPVSE